MDKHAISQAELRLALVQTGGRSTGKPMSAASVSRLVNKGLFPRMTPERTIRDQVEAFLKTRGVPEEAMKELWRPPDGGRQSDAVNRRVGQHPVLFDPPLPEIEMISQQARKHFALFRDPFLDDVQGPEDVFLSGEQRYIREAMFQTSRLGGFLAVIGESGAGKTTLRRDLIDRIRRESQAITVIQPRTIDKTRLTASSICEAIIADLSQEMPKSSLEAKARQIERLLVGSSRSGHAHVLIIEEAHDLTVQTIKYLKRFWELEDGFKKLLAILLIGQPELKNKLDERQNWEAREVIRRCEIAELRPLDAAVADYLALKFGRIDAPVGRIFEADAYDAIRERLTLRMRGSNQTVSMLYPLVVNNLVARAMNLCAEIGAPAVGAEQIMGV